MPKYKYKLYEIIWDDAQTDDGWDEPPEDLKPAVATTVGFVIRETKTHILIASTYDESHTNGRLQIPKAMIISKKEIK